MVSQKKDCYLGIDGKKHGPMTEADVQKLYDDEKITGDTKFTRLGDTKWITVAEAGVFTPPLPDDDGLPPLPPDDVPMKTNEPRKAATKKSKLPFVAAGLGVAVVACVIVLIIVIGNMGNDTDIVAGNNVTQGDASQDHVLSPTPSLDADIGSDEWWEEWISIIANAPRLQITQADNSELDVSTFRIANSNIIFDFPSHFIYEADIQPNWQLEYMDGVYNISARFVNPLWDTNCPIVEGYSAFFDTAMFFDFSPWTRWRDGNHVRSDFTGWAIPFEEFIVEYYEDIVLIAGGRFELLGTIESATGSGFYFLAGYTDDVFDTEMIILEYTNHGFSDDMGYIRPLQMKFYIPADYENYIELFRMVIGSIRYADGTQVTKAPAGWVTVSDPLASFSLQVPQGWSFNYREAWPGFQIFDAYLQPAGVETHVYAWGSNASSDLIPLDADSWPGSMFLHHEELVEDFLFNDGVTGMRLEWTSYTLFARTNEERGEKVVLFISIFDPESPDPEWLDQDRELTNLIGATLTVF